MLCNGTSYNTVTVPVIKECQCYLCKEDTVPEISKNDSIPQNDAVPLEQDEIPTDDDDNEIKRRSVPTRFRRNLGNFFQRLFNL